MNRKRSSLLGLGLDGDDGHTRVTQGDDLLLVGGSEETHERMQEHVMKLNEELERRGKALGDCSPVEIGETLKEVAERCQ